MKLDEAARQWLEARTAQKDAEKRVDEAAKVLKDHFRKTGRTNYKGKIGWSSAQYTALDTAKARELLAERAHEAEVTRTRETLTPLG